jgi:hypothetical protein
VVTSIINALRIFLLRNAKMKTGMGNDFFLQICAFRQCGKLRYRPRSVLLTLDQFRTVYVEKWLESVATVLSYIGFFLLRAFV